MPKYWTINQGENDDEVLLILKLLGKLAISWLWVTAPLWGGVALFGVFAVFCLVMSVITGQTLRKR